MAHSDLNKSTLLDELVQRYPGENEFHQAVSETLPDILGSISKADRATLAPIIRRLLMPERNVRFTIAWRNGEDETEIHQGYRIQHNGALGPYKGGLRFHPALNASILHFLAYEQTFKNALTGLPLGSGKGGADFDPKGRTDADINRFCNAFMAELVRHIGGEEDVPAGDINVGARELGYLFGAYRRLRGFEPQTLTGKPEASGGNVLRNEATGFGLVLFVKCMLAASNDDLDGKRVLISGAGNVATHAARMAVQSGAKVLTLSDSGGLMVCEDGFSADAIDTIAAAKAEGASLADCASDLPGDYDKGAKPWRIKADIALPCATQNELDAEDAQALVGNGAGWLAEGANMPCTRDARDALDEGGVIFAPGRAANAGGVAMSGFEMAANRIGLPRDREESMQFLEKTMQAIHDRCQKEGGDGDRIDYAKGATVAGFNRVADAMLRAGLR